MGQIIMCPDSLSEINTIIVIVDLLWSIEMRNNDDLGKRGDLNSDKMHFGRNLEILTSIGG